MKYIIIFIYSLSLFAQIGYEKSDQGIYLTALSCSTLKKEVIGIPNNETFNCTCENNKCKIDITDSLPKRMKDLLIQESTYLDTANCFNSVEYVKGLTDILTNSNHIALDAHVNSELCEETSTPQFGDIITIGNENGLEHAFIYLTPNMSFTRNGGIDYQIQKTKNTFLVYGGLTSEPSDYSILSQLEDRCIGATKEEAEKFKCHLRAIFHRCKPVEKQTLSNLRQEFVPTFKKVNERTLNGKEYNTRIINDDIIKMLDKFEALLPKKLQEQLILSYPTLFKNLTSIQQRTCLQEDAENTRSEIDTTSKRINVLENILKEKSLDSYKYFLIDIKQLKLQIDLYNSDYGSFVGWNEYGENEYLIKYKEIPFTRPLSQDYFNFLESIKIATKARKEALLKADIKHSDLTDSDNYESLKEGEDSLEKAQRIYDKYYNNEFKKLKKEGRVFKKGYDGKDYTLEDLNKMTPLK